MKTTEFYSNRIQNNVAIVLSPMWTYYISEVGDEWRIKRNSSWHFDDDGLWKAQDYFEDPLFDKQMDEYSQEEDAELETMIKSFWDCGQNTVV